jgi:predicted lipoprotein with Yx(FWY)xxD motif
VSSNPQARPGNLAANIAVARAGTGMGQSGRQGSARVGLVLRLIGAGLLVTTGAIHLDLYLTGYRTIPTIGWLFLLQVIGAFGLGVGVFASGRRLAPVAGAGLALSTLGGYLLSLRISLFGFREVRTTAGIVAGVIEMAAFAVLAELTLGSLSLRPASSPAPHDPSLLDRLEASIPVARWVSAALTALAAVLLGVSVAATGPAPTSSGSRTALLRVAKIDGVPVLTNARGFTLYWFVPDTSTKSTCYGTCALYWPPVTGSPIAGPGVIGKLGTISRSGGETQVTYDRHPLYTYVGDSAPGQAKGNNINLNGGLWHEMTASGK